MYLSSDSTRWKKSGTNIFHYNITYGTLFGLLVSSEIFFLSPALSPLPPPAGKQEHKSNLSVLPQVSTRMRESCIWYRWLSLFYDYPFQSNLQTLEAYGEFRIASALIRLTKTTTNSATKILSFSDGLWNRLNTNLRQGRAVGREIFKVDYVDHERKIKPNLWMKTTHPEKGARKRIYFICSIWVIWNIIHWIFFNF